LVVFVLDNDGLIRGYKLIDLTDFADTRSIESQNGFMQPTRMDASVTLSYQPPSDVKNMRIWVVLYSVGIGNYGRIGFSEDEKYQRIVMPTYREALCSQDISYTYLSYQDLSWIIAGSFFTTTSIVGILFDLFVIRRIPKADPVWPFLVYLLLFATGVVLTFWFFFHISP
jgi:hypothetical protein